MDLFGEEVVATQQDPNDITREELNAFLQMHPLQEPFFVTYMKKAIKDVNEYSWKRGEMGGLDWGFDSLNKAFEGVNTGVILVAGGSNVGKSSFLIQLAWQIAKANRETSEKRPNKSFVIYFSLDDNLNELLPRVIAVDQKIPINVVRYPKKYEDNGNLMTRREAGFQRLQEAVDHFVMYDVTAGNTIEYIEQTIEQYYVALKQIDESYQLVVFIDNYHDVDTENNAVKGTENSKFNYTADKFTQMSSRYDCPIICTAELRKLNGNRRPQNEDIKDTNKILYEAKAVMLVHNEVSLRGQQANVFWNASDKLDKQPVFEVHVGKNKYSGFKGRCFFEFIPEMALCKEVPEAGNLKYNQMISG
jgi:replicative DNA helicase